MSTPFSTCDLCDEHESDTSGAFRILPPVFQSFGTPLTFCGPVHTVRAPEDNSFVREMVGQPGEGRVLVVDGGRSLRRALMGGNVAATAARNGWAGALIDGSVRDVEELRECGLPIRALALIPIRTAKSGQGSSGQPVQVQGVWIRTGDWLYADEDGIVLGSRDLR